MKLFLSKLLIVIIPVGILLVTMEMLNRRNDESSIYFQKKYFLENSDKLDGLIFGSSFMWCGIQPQYLDGNVGSFALAGSALNIDYSIFSYAKEVSQPKFVLLDASKTYFVNYQGGHFIRSTKLPYYFPTIKDHELTGYFLTEMPLSQYFPLKTSLKYDQRGYQLEIPEEWNVFKEVDYQDSLIDKHPRVERQYASMKGIIRANKVQDNLDLYRKILEECLEENIKVVFVSPPKYHLFNEFVDRQRLEERDAFMKEVVDNEHIFFLNYDKAYEKNSQLFFDLNHLNNEGSMEFTKALNRDLKSILN
ncbi:hypothetical protein [Roseivirga sp.]|uniref:hypothetical protein n=1 Tax=Roseivirga sp. TaxID=1964215 RepID=UPI003B8B9F5B